MLERVGHGDAVLVVHLEEGLLQVDEQLEDLRLHADVECGDGFVEDDHRRVLQHHAGEGQQLGLPGAEAAGGQGGLYAGGQRVQPVRKDRQRKRTTNPATTPREREEIAASFAEQEAEEKAVEEIETTAGLTPEEIARRCLAMATGEPVEDVAGGRLLLRPDSICVHGDTPGALAVARAVRTRLEEAGVRLAPFAPAPTPTTPPGG